MSRGCRRRRGRRSTGRAPLLRYGDLSGVDRVYRDMLRWNAQWRLNLDIANVTSAFSAINVAPAVTTSYRERWLQRGPQC